MAKPPEDRAAFLDQACGGDAEVRADLEALLRHDSEAGEDFLRPPPADPRLAELLRGDDAPDPLIGQTIKAFTIREVIARGGMGTVYLAEQSRPRRDVALKVLHSGLWSRSAERRFEFESQVLARLHHPNIAQVYEAGTHKVDQSRDREGAVPPASIAYFAMEYIPNARPITRYAEEKRLGIRERLTLFLQVCDAVQHGHAKGVIHRDLKPANILVGDESDQPSGAGALTGNSPALVPPKAGGGTGTTSAIVKVIDFGVARAVDADVALTRQTDAGQLIGTLQYMSPEQAGGTWSGGTGVSPVTSVDIDTRSDVYSLGVVLYELLTGRVPYDVSNLTIHSAARRICEQPPTKPSEFKRRLRGDLETIVLKALEKDRDKRYASVADLAADLRRYLNREPISARPPTAWTRALRWASRHPLAVTAAACAVFVMATLAATKATVWWYDVRPDELEWPDDHSNARLLAYSGRTLRRWGGNTPGEIPFAKLLHRYPKPDGGLYALIGFSLDSDSPYKGTLCAFDALGDRDTPVWQSRIEGRDVPEKLLKEGRGPGTYTPHGRCKGIVADIFDDQDAPGDEIVVVFTHGDSSQRALRILNQKADVLFQVWQDGGIEWLCWLSGPRLLVCAGNDEYLKLNDPRFRSRPNAPTAAIVFAIRPVHGLVLNEFMGRTPSEEALFSPEWAKYIDPPKEEDLHFKLQLDRSAGADPSRFAHLSVVISSEKDKKLGNLHWLIDEHGVEVPDSRGRGDNYLFDQHSHKPRLPDPDTIRLSDLRPAPSKPPYVKPEPPEPP